MSTSTKSSYIPWIFRIKSIIKKSKASKNSAQTRGYNYATASEAAPGSDKPLPTKKEKFSRGHTVAGSNLHRKDPQGQHTRGRARKRKQGTGGDLDAASTGSKLGPKNTGKGDPEGTGMVDQVGSASGTAKHFQEK